MDPLHGRLEGLLGASQFALLAVMDQGARDAEFLNQLESNQKGDKAQGLQQDIGDALSESEGGKAQGLQQDIGDAQNESESKRVESGLRSRKTEHRLEKFRRRQEKTAESSQKLFNFLRK